MSELLAEYRDREEPDGEPLSYLWSLTARPVRADGDAAVPE